MTVSPNESFQNPHLSIPPNVIIQRIIVSLQTTADVTSNSSLDVHTILGTRDHVHRVFTEKNFTILNLPWNEFHQRTKIDVWDLWPEFQVS